MRIEERFEGAMLGLAIGDALGYPVEFLTRSQLFKTHPPHGVTGFARCFGHERIGVYSDDTQMTIAVAEALLAADLSSLDSIMAEVKKTFIAWANSPENNRAPGQTCMDGARRMSDGVHWFSSGDPYSKGCGAAMRVAPIGLVFRDHPDRLIEVARAVSICTHAHPTGIASGIAAAAMVAHAVRGEPAHTLLSSLKSVLRQTRGEGTWTEVVSHDPLGEQIAAIDRVLDVLLIEPEAAFEELGGGWVGEEAVAGAAYAYLRHPESFKEAILVAANASRAEEDRADKGRCDRDSIACIAGGIAGAALGRGSLPPEWVQDVEGADVLSDLGRRLAALSV